MKNITLTVNNDEQVTEGESAGWSKIEQIIFTNEKLEKYVRILDLKCISPAQSFAFRGSYGNQTINLEGLYGIDPQIIVNSIHESQTSQIPLELHIFFSDGVQYCIIGVIGNYQVAHSVTQPDHSISFNVFVEKITFAERETPNWKEIN